jgi:hypothetical protein
MIIKLFTALDFIFFIAMGNNQLIKYAQMPLTMPVIASYVATPYHFSPYPNWTPTARALPKTDRISISLSRFAGPRVLKTTKHMPRESEDNL